MQKCYIIFILDAVIIGSGNCYKFVYYSYLKLIIPDAVDA